ncbi:MAG: three-Cys-motif partner protein TcmP [Gemmatimonadetes bacterium]|nr:three-Cys-motif partner protein TcmP [Gemmatimonadota bacterium]
MTPRAPRSVHQFGGDWTARKLHAVQRYLNAYTTALRRQPFTLLYVDAFAGTPFHETSPLAEIVEPLFLGFDADEPTRLLEGSARRALQVEPPFDRYLFFEKHRVRCAQLEQLRADFPALADRIVIERREANDAIRTLCAGGWAGRRATMFLDPYGMQVEWATIEAIAATRAVDLWVLFPLGIAVNRLITRSGEIPPPWRHRLDLMLGSEEWYQAFYEIVPEPTLFGDDRARVVKASQEVIGGYFTRRLRGIFSGVADRPAILQNSRGMPLYLLCFAVGNPRGTETALRIANHILREAT